MISNRSISLFIRFLLVLAFVGIASVSAYASLEINPRIDSAMVCLVEQQYEKARTTVYAILKDDPGDLDALYMLLTIKQTELLDYESYNSDGESFVELADSVLRVLKQELPAQRGSDSTQHLFYLGNVYGGKSLILAKNGNWLQAIREAITSVSLLKKVREIDSTFYAAYLGLGVFNYYLSQNLGWVPFMGDKSQQGLRDIEMATQARFPYNYAAQNSLCWILIDQDKYQKADSIVTSVLDEFPENTIFLRIRARIKLWTQQYDTAAFLGNQLANISKSRVPINWSDLISAYQIIAACNIALGQQETAKDVARKALSIDIPESSRRISYVKKHLAYLAKVANGSKGTDSVH